VQPPFRNQSEFNSSRDEYDVLLSLDASASWGRVRDATPVYQVEVLEERLRETGTLHQPLSRHAREQLAALYTVEGDVAFAHQRPTKYFWRELERILREDGVLDPGGLDAYAVQRLLEPITITGAIVARTAGYTVGPVFHAVTTQFHSAEEQVNSASG